LARIPANRLHNSTALWQLEFQILTEVTSNPYSIAAIKTAR